MNCAEILIITNTDDPHVDLVERRLEERDVESYRMNTDTLGLDEQISIILGDATISGEFRQRENQLDLSSVRSVLYRRPEPPTLPLVDDPSARKIARAEAWSLLNQTWSVLGGAFWVSKPHSIRHAENKLLQLKLAMQLGLAIPKTLITNDAEEVRSFLQAFDSVAVKPISGVVLEKGGEFQAMYTRRIEMRDFDQDGLDSLASCPVLLQEYVDKSYELRVTVVGNSAVAAKLDSQASDSGRIDWRRAGGAEVKHSIVELPPKIEKACVDIVRLLNLNFGAIDLVVTPENRYTFLECNANGQWAWIEGLTGFEISTLIADLLIDGTRTGGHISRFSRTG